MYEINQERQLELLRRLLFAWDAQWFLKSAAAFGPDEALKVNARVRAAYGRLEMKAMLALLGQEKATNLADSLEIIKTYHQIGFSHNPILSGTHLVASDSPNGGRGKALVALNRCVALDNAKRSALPVSPSDANCIYCQMLWTTWFETLLPDAQIEVAFESQPMQGAPHGVLAVTSFRAATAAASFEAMPTATPYPETATPIAYNQPVAYPSIQPAQNFGVTPDNYPPTTISSQPTTYPTAYYTNPLGSTGPEVYPPSQPTAAPNPFSADYPPTATSYSNVPASYPSPTPAAYGNVEPSYPPAASNAAPLIGGNEVPADNNRGIVPSGSLRQRLQQSREPNSPPSTVGQTVMPPSADEPVLVPTTNIDPATGRPLFNGDMERLIESGVKSTKKKNLNLISRVMLSKEAQQLLKQSADNPAPPVVPMTLANSIDAILQRLLIAEHNERPSSITGAIRVSNRPNGDLLIQVGSNYYDSVEAVPPGRTKELLQQAVSMWYESQ